MGNPSKRSIRFGAVLAALMVGFAAPSGAQLIYSNGVPDGVDAWAINFGFGEANDFSLLSGATLGSFDWYSAQSGNSGAATVSSNFNWAVYNDAGGSPGSTVLGSGTVVGGTGTLTPYTCCSGLPFDVYLYSTSFGGLTLGSGTYWLAIGDFFSAGDDGRGYWAESADQYSGGNQATTQDGGASWTSYGAEGAFSVYGTESTVPEPASLALLATGLLGLVPTLRRKFRS